MQHQVNERVIGTISISTKRCVKGVRKISQIFDVDSAMLSATNLEENPPLQTQKCVHHVARNAVQICTFPALLLHAIWSEL